MDDPIGDALAIALDEIDEHAGDGRYSPPDIAPRIETVRAAMEDLQLLLQSTLN